MSKSIFFFEKKIVKTKFQKIKNFEKNDIKLINSIKNNIPFLIDLINKQNLNEYLKSVVNFSFDANKYFNDSEPWLFKEKGSRTNEYNFIHNCRTNKKYIYSFKSNYTIINKKSFKHNKYI